MSRIGKKPVAIPATVTLTVDGQTVSVKGPKGTLSFTVPVSLGPRILRADTAAISAMTLWQSALGDWLPSL